MIDPTMLSAHRRAVVRTGERVTIQRISGTAPRTVSFSAEVMANVQAYAPDSTEVSQTGYAATQPGAITQSDRKVIVIAQDLLDQRFPLPIRKNDKIILADGAKCNVNGVDAHKRSIAGAIEMTVSSVA
jgi:hypothetical protein